MISGAEIMVKCLEKEGVSVTFGYPGAAICPFYDYLYKSQIRHVLVRSEQNAAHAASGYARSACKPGVCIATSGPGATNLITGIATAYMDSIPMVAITGQVNSELLGRDVFQEADITGACEPFTKHSYLVKDPAELPRVFKEAFHIASTGRPGPVLIDVPMDVQQAKVAKFTYPEKAEIVGYKPRTEGHVMQIKKAVKAIEEAKRPILCCGGGVVLANAREEMVEFARNSGIPVCATMMGIGVIPMDSPYYLGMIGMHGRTSANRAMQQADLVILCGARVGDRAVSAPQQIAEKAKVIHIDVDPAEIGKNMAVDIPIVGDVKLVLQKLTFQVKNTVPKEWLEQVFGFKRTYPGRGCYFGGGRWSESDLVRPKFQCERGQVSHLRWVGNHGIFYPGGHGCKDCEAPPSGGGCLRGWLLPDEYVRIGNHLPAQGACENYCDGKRPPRYGS